MLPILRCKWFYLPLRCRRCRSLHCFEAQPDGTCVYTCTYIRKPTDIERFENGDCCKHSKEVIDER